VRIPRKVFKYPLKVVDLQSIVMPRLASLLTVQVQRGEPQLWALVDPEEISEERRHIAIVGTGNPMPPYSLGNYLGTFQLEGGALVFHAFEVFEP
jgi:hypothetical protein